MRCPSCERPGPDGARFCAACGAELPLRCSGCGAALQATDRFCGACGRTAAGQDPRPERVQGFARQAEHRQITVVFCDLVGSTGHASKLDPEDWRDVVRRFQQVCVEAIARFEGHVAQYLGDGLLVYFGYPRAHEDDAERAIRAALGVMQALERLNPQLRREHGLELEARIGIHTGPVVVGEMGRDGRSEMLAMGTSAHVAARLQAIAQAGTILVSDETLQLVQGIFVTETLGTRSLKGVARPLTLHRVLQASGVRSRLAVAGSRLTPFVGREREMGLLVDSWERVLDGEGQSVLVQGSAGIGKSRLVLALRERLSGDPHTWLECRGSSYDQASAFHPMIELLEDGLDFSPRDDVAEKLHKLVRGIELAGFDEEEALVAIAGLLGLPLAEGKPASPEALRETTLETLAAWTLALARNQPVVLLVEDLHWLDPSSLDLLGRLIERIPTSRVLALLTARADFEAPWPAPANWTVLALESLRRRQARQLVMARAGAGALSRSAVERIVERADGVPLFLEELAQAALESEAEGATLAIPASLKDSLTARLDRLGDEKELAQLASVIGREFPQRLLESAAQADPTSVRRSLERLVASELVLRHGDPPEATYVFRHALIQEAAYGSLLRRRRRGLHERVARALERCSPERVASEPAMLARHFDEAGLPAEAIRYYELAGQRETARSALEEAIAHLKRGLELVPRLPESERDPAELRLRVALGPALIAARGVGDVEAGETYLRARTLSATGAPELLHILPGVYTYYLNRGQAQAAFQVAQEQLALAQAAADPALLMRAHWSLGQTLCVRGFPVQAARELQQAVELFDPSRDRLLSHDRSDQGVSLRSWLAWATWLSGRPDRAFEWGDEAVAVARRGGHPYSLAYGLGFDAVLHYMARDAREARRRALEAVAVSQEWGFPLYLGLGRLVALWAEAPSSLEDDPGGKTTLELFRGALGSLSSRGGRFGMALTAAALAEILCAAGRPADALETVRTSLAHGSETGIRFWDAELLRIEGEILLQGDPEAEPGAGERLLARALETARKQGAKSLELRAATSLARLWCRRGEHERGRELLAPLHGSFPAGCETPDLEAAAALLGQAGSGP